MRKELIYAIIAGIFFGLIVAFGIWRINVSMKNQKGSSTSQNPSPSPKSFGLALSEPEDGDILSESPTMFSGITKAGSWAIISINDRDNLVKPNDSGVFEKNVEMNSGINSIQVSSINSLGESNSQNLFLVYSTEFGKNAVPIPSPTPASSTSESDIRQKVQEKVQKILNNPKFYMGSVTDIAESTIQLKTSSGEIKLISVDQKDITVIKIEPSNKEVKFGDIAIGDFIVAMGYQNGNGVLETKRILITTEVKELKLNVIIGKIASMTKVDIATENAKITPAKNSKIKLSNFKTGDSIIAVGTKLEDGTFSARTIFKITLP